MPETIEGDNVAETGGGDDLHLIYKIEGQPHEVDIFELSRVLESLGQVLQEGNRIVHDQQRMDLEIKVKPFEPGSFIVDLGLHLQQNAAYLAFLGSPEMLAHLKEVLEYIGLIKKTREVGASLLELLRRLRNGKPEKVEKTPRTYEYHATDGGVITVSPAVHNLYNSGTVNNFIFNIAAPAERPEVAGIKTYIKDAEELTGVTINRADAAAIKAYHEPPVLLAAPEVLESTTIHMLHPKSGNYGGTTGQWIFKVAGTSQTLKAKITDIAFLSQYTNGIIRFYAADLLKARVKSEQRVEGSKVRTKNEITEVLEYRPAPPSERS
jgi:hypothetical protein